jgi:hypothetical protein
VTARAAVVVPLALALALAARTAGRISCTVDEFGNLPLTVVYRSADALHIDRGNPPLTRWIQGLGLLPGRPDPGVTRRELAGIETSWDLGYRFERAHADDYHALLVRARMGSIALLLFTVLGVWVWARDLAGPLPALGAALLAAASPNLIAHGRLVTPDIGIACFVLWASWAAHRAIRSGSFRWTAAAGVLAAAAVLAKFSGLLLLPLLAVAVAAGTGSARARLTRFALFSAVVLVALYAAWGFPPPGRLAGAPTLLPAPLTEGIAAQLDEPPYPAYLLGEVREGGWPWYYVVAFLVKVPLPAIALFVLAAVVALRERRADCALPWIVAAVFFAALGFGTKKNVGLRYVLPVLPLLHVASAAALGAIAPAVRRTAAGLVVLAVGLGVAASGTPIAHFNGVERLLGGKRHVLCDSNLDWGQALPDLRDWMRREEIDSIRLAYFGRVDPSLYGIEWSTLPAEPVNGPVAISATLAVGRPYVVLFKERPFLEPVPAWSRPDTWAWIRERRPDMELGGGAILAWRDLRPGTP